MNSLTITAPARMPAVKQNWHALEKVDRYDEFTPLLPLSTCQQIVAELSDVKPCPDAKGSAVCAALVVGSYPNAKNIADPEIYARALTSLFDDYPIDVCNQAVDIVTRTCKFTPSRAEVAEVLDSIQRQRDTIRRRAEWMVKEHERRAKVAADKARMEMDRCEHFDFSQILKSVSRKVA